MDCIRRRSGARRRVDMDQVFRAKKPKPYIQTAVSTVAFLVWAYATGGAPPLWPGAIYNPLHATILIAGFTAISGLVTKA